MSASIAIRPSARLAAAPFTLSGALVALFATLRLAGDGGTPQGPRDLRAFANPLFADAGPTRSATRGHGDLSVLVGDPVIGSNSALVTIVVFSDFQCPFCSRVEQTLQALRTRYGADLRFVWKDYPLAFHSDAKPAAVAARTVFLARGNAAFWAAHDTLFARQRELKAAIPDVLSAAGVDDVTARKLAPEATRLVEDGSALGGEVGVGGTPAFFIDGELLSGAQPESSFQVIIDRHLGEARALRASGVPPSRLYAAMLARHRPPNDAKP
jgi:protein-disulfide isomerase